MSYLYFVCMILQFQTSKSSDSVFKIHHRRLKYTQILYHFSSYTVISVKPAIIILLRTTSIPDYLYVRQIEVYWPRLR